MKSGLTLSQLAAELERQTEAKQDFLVDTRELTMLSASQEDADAPTRGFSELHLPNGKGEYVANDSTHRQIGSRLRIPAAYYDRLRQDHPALLDHNVNTLFREAPERRMIRCFNWSPEDRVARAFLSDRYRRLDNDELAHAVLPILGEIPDVKIATSQITDSRMYITALAPRIESEVKVGDTVQAGVRITNSEIGHGALKVEPLIFRLICLNGMVVDAATRHYHIGRQIDSEEALKVLSDATVQKDDAAFFSKLADVTRAAVDETRFNAIVAEMREAASGQTIQKPLEALEVMQRRFDFSDGEKESVLKHLIEGGDLSAYGALNAVTRAAQDVESYDRSMELEHVGGKILALAGTTDWAALAAA